LGKFCIISLLLCSSSVGPKDIPDQLQLLPVKVFHDKTAQEVREASGSGDGDVVVTLAESEGGGMPGVDKEKAAFSGNLL
jgi:hypothetical protein